MASYLRCGQNFSKNNVICCSRGALAAPEAGGNMPGAQVAGKEFAEQHPACPLCLWSRCQNLGATSAASPQHRYTEPLWSMASSMSLWASATRRPRGCCCALVLSGVRTTALWPEPAPAPAAPAAAAAAAPRRRLLPEALLAPVGKTNTHWRAASQHTLESSLHCSHPPPVPIPAEQDLPCRTQGSRW